MTHKYLFKHFTLQLNANDLPPLHVTDEYMVVVKPHS